MQMFGGLWCFSMFYSNRVAVVVEQPPEIKAPAYNLAMIFNGLGERDKAFEWLERGFQQRDQRMVFLKVEPKWDISAPSKRQVFAETKSLTQPKRTLTWEVVS
jgi:hypothetical protein